MPEETKPSSTPAAATEWRAEPKERVTVYLCVGDHRQVKETAARMGMSMSQLITELLRNSIHVIRHDEEKK